jgi:hypothetical protein
MNKFFSYHLLPIIHAYNAGISRLQSHITAPVVDPDLGRAAWLSRYIVPRPSWLGSDIVSMTWQQHRATAKLPRQRHRAMTKIALTTPSPAGLGIIVVSMTRQRCRHYDSVSTVTSWPSCLGNTITSMTRLHRRQHDSTSTQHHCQYDSAEPSLTWLGRDITQWLNRQH